MPGFTILITATGEESLDLADHYQPAPGAGPARTAATPFAAQQLAAQVPPQHPDAVWGITQIEPGKLSVQEVIRIPGITVDPFGDDALFALGQLLILTELHHRGDVPHEIYQSAQELAGACGYGPTETAIAAAYLGTHRMGLPEVDALAENPDQLLRLARILRAGWEQFDPRLRLDGTSGQQEGHPSRQHDRQQDGEPAHPAASVPPPRPVPDTADTPHSLDGPKNATTLPFRPSFEPEAYTAGVIVGERLADLLREAPSDIVPTLTFWLNAGKALEHLFPEAEGDIVNPFIRGAQSSFPSDLLPAVVVTVPRLSVLRSPATAHPPTNTQSTDDLSTDDPTTTAKAPTDEPGGVRAQIADLLEQAADRIRAGQSTGILRTSGLQPGGTFDVHAPEQETR